MTDDVEENTPDNADDAKPWLCMIKDAEKVFDPWWAKCDSIDKLYANLANLASETRHRSLQVFYANVEVLKGVVYSREPAPVCVPRFKDSKPLPNKASEMLERVMVSSFDIEKVHKTLIRVRDNLVLHGRGVVWCRYAQKGESERVAYDWLHRRDFLHEPARIWNEVGWTAKGIWLTKAQGKKRFGKKWKGINYVADAKDTAEGYKYEKKARVWELWHRERNTVVWLHPDADHILDQKDPWLTLEGFFPCTEPAYGTCEPDSLLPVPDFLFYKDQIEEVIDLTKRISALTQAVRMRGYYAKGAEKVGQTIEKLLKDMDDRQVLIGIDNLAAIGGASLKDSIVWLPVRETVETIKMLIEERRVLLQDIYEISGISDIMRGQTEASETLGAQQLKSQYGSIRVKGRQGEMVRVADELLNIGGEIMAENFQTKTLLEMSQEDGLARHDDIQKQIAQIKGQVAKAQQDPQLMAQAQQNPQAAQQIVQQATDQIQKLENTVTVEAVMGLFRSQKMRPFVMKVATDSTIQPDENAEKAARNEFGQAFAQVTTALGPIIQADPGAAPFAGEMLKFMLAPFRAGRQMDQAVDEFVEQAKAKASQPPPPSPDQIKAEQQAAKDKADLADREQQRAAKAQELAQQQAEQQREDARQANKDRIDAMIADAQARAEVQKIERQAQADREKHEHERAMRAADIRLKQIDLEIAEARLAESKTRAKETQDA